jgi:hypothetical protein
VSEFNNSLSNRLFAAFLSILVALPTGWGLFRYSTHNSSTDRQDWMSRAFVHVAMDVVALAFALSLLGLVWATFNPPWIGRLLRFAQRHFVKALVALFCILVAMLVYGFAAIYVR